MPQALWIFRKDFRRFWGLLAVVVPLEAAVRWGDSVPTGANALFLIGLLSRLAQWFLIVSLIHGEAVPGNRQYWLTRPIAWRDLLLAKAMFVLLFIHLPCFLTDAATLAVHGQPVIRFLPSLLVCQLFLLAEVVLPAAAIAAITANLTQLVWHSLALYTAFYVSVLRLSAYVPTSVDWGGVEWFRSTVTAALMIAMTVAILLVQYARRNTRVSRCILAAALPCLLFCLWMPGWYAAFALQERIGPHTADASAIRLALDSARQAEQPTERTFWSWQNSVGFYLPVRVTGIPAGMQLHSNRASVTLTTPDGRTWTSGWDSLQKLVRATERMSIRRGEEQFLVAGDECWQYLNIDASFFLTLRSPVRVHIASAMTLFSQPEDTSMGHGAGLRSMPGGGSCWASGTPMVACVWPGRMPEVNTVRASPIPTGASAEYLLSPWGSSKDVADYGPYTANASLWQISVLTMYPTPPPQPAEIALRSRRAIAHFECELDILINDPTSLRFRP